MTFSPDKSVNSVTLGDRFLCILPHPDFNKNRFRYKLSTIIILFIPITLINLILKFYSSFTCRFIFISLSFVNYLYSRL